MYFFLILLVALGFFAREPIGRFVWSTLGAPRIGLFLTKDAELALEIGNYYFNVYGDGIYDLNHARYYFEYALMLDSKVPDAWHQLARIDFLRGNYYDALDKINTQIVLHGDSFMASYYIRGLIYGYMGDLVHAKENFLKFKEWDPNNWAIHNDLAWIYFKMGEYTQAEREAREGLEWNQGNAWLLTALGVALLNQSNHDEARTTLLAAQKAITRLTEQDWHKAYPGNNPAVAAKGIREMAEIAKKNLALLEQIPVTH